MSLQKLTKAQLIQKIEELQAQLKDMDNAASEAVTIVDNFNKEVQAHIVDIYEDKLEQADARHAKACRLIGEMTLELLDEDL